MNASDTEFFEKNWKRWIAANPKPENWKGTPREYAQLEMPCRGYMGRVGFYLSLFFSANISSEAQMVPEPHTDEDVPPPRV
ncbi:hypothetical protein [Coraliomargarita parva]|uniref:hypothetical protein n=1 Tax=Coraliomargarita parva TaxID=3014050 RepID=UPI0022B56D1C|nr:hypothetical protein [Coraliomargarita parva]